MFICISRTIAPLVLLCLTAFPAPAEVFRNPGPEIALTDFELGPPPGDPGTPRIASNGEDFLVTWYGHNGVRGARIDASGELLDPTGFLIAPPLTYGHDVAWTGSDYLVLLGFFRGARVNSDGTVARVSGGIPGIGVNATATNSVGMLVTWGDATGRIVVRRLSFLNSEGEMEVPQVEIVAGDRTIRDGTIAASDDDFLLIDPGGYAVRLNGELEILQRVQLPAGNPYTAAAADGNYLIAWTVPDSSRQTSVVFASLLTAEGLGPAEVVAEPPRFAENLNVAAAGDQFLVTWSLNVPDIEDSPIYGRRYDRTGRPVDAASFLIASDGRAADVTSNGEVYLVTGQDRRGARNWSFSNLYGTIVPRSGPPLGDFAAVLSAPWQSAPATASNGRMAVIAWSEATSDILAKTMAARVTSDGTVLDRNGIQLAPEPGRTAVAAADDRFLVAWRVGNHPIRARILREDGTTTNPVTITEDFTLYDPNVAWDGENFWVMWLGGEPVRIRAVRLNRSGFVIDSVPFDLGEGTAPAIGFDGIYLWVVYTTYNVSTGFEVRARRLRRSGFVEDTEPILLSRDPDTHEVSISCATRTCLVAWTTFQSEIRRIRGVIVTSSAAFVAGTVDAPLSISHSTATISDLSLAFDGSAFLVSWWSGVTLPGRDADVLLTTVSPAGAVGPLIKVAAGPQDERNPGVTSIGNRPLLTYERLTEGEESGAVYRVFFKLFSEMPPRHRAVRR